MKCGKPSRDVILHAVAAVFVANACMAEPPPELVGVMQDSTGSYAALRSGPARPGVWMREGARFGEFVVAQIDEHRGVVTLRAGASSVELALPTSRVQSSHSSEAHRGASVTAELAASTPAVRRNLRALTSAAWQHFWDTETTRATTADFVGPDRALHRVEAAAGEDYASVSFALNADGSVSVVGADGAPIPPATSGAVSILVSAGT